MGRKIGIIAAVCLALTLCFALVGCGGGVDKSKYTGDWKLAYGTDENLDAQSIELMDSLGISVVMTLNEDGTGTMDMFGEKVDLSWEATSNTEGKVTLQDKDKSEGALKLSENEELSIEDSSGASMTFRRK